MSPSPIEPFSPVSDIQQLRVRRGRVESVDLYEIKDNELEILENGTPSSLYLNFSIFLLSLTFSAIACLSTATFINSTVEVLFIVVAVIGTMVGGFLLILWWKTKESVKKVIEKIRERIPPEVQIAKRDAPVSDLDPQG